MKKQWKRLLSVMIAIALVVGMLPAELAQAAPKNTAVVSTQKALKKALKNDKITKIKIKTDANKTFKISKGNYADKLLIVDAPKATIKNSGKVKNISVADAKKFVEKASGNKIKVTDESLELKVAAKAEVKKIDLAKTDAKDEIIINGIVKKLAVSQNRDSH